MNSPECLSGYLHIVTSSTHTELKILKALLWFHKEKVAGNFEVVFPERDTIARMSKCSLCSVANFIKKFEGIIFSHKTRRNFETGKHNSNIYFFNKDFMDHVILLEGTSYLDRLIKFKNERLKQLKIEIWQKFMKNEYFLHEIVYENGRLLNNPIRHGFYSKLDTIKSFFLFLISRHNVLPKVPDKNPTEEKSFELLKNIKLSYSQKKSLVDKFSLKTLKDAIRDYLYKRTIHAIENVNNFIYMCARKRTLQTLTVRR